jgi:uncharacterized protein
VDGETDLTALVAGMRPELREGEFFYCVLRTPDELPAGVALCTFAEDEGITAIVPRADAQRAGLRGIGPFRAITLAVESSLAAVGFTAVVSRALADAGIPANVVAAFHHDHLFVPADRAGDALRLLLRLRDEVVELGGERVGTERRLRREA